MSPVGITHKALRSCCKDSELNLSAEYYRTYSKKHPSVPASAVSYASVHAYSPGRAVQDIRGAWRGVPDNTANWVPAPPLEGTITVCPALTCFSQGCRQQWHAHSAVLNRVCCEGADNHMSEVYSRSE